MGWPLCVRLSNHALSLSCAFLGAEEEAEAGLREDKAEQLSDLTELFGEEAELPAARILEEECEG